jgi:hypothetical protein
MEGTRARTREHATATILRWVYDLSILIGFTLSHIIHDISFMTICIYYLVLEMADDRRTMYDGFSKKSGHSTE